jgi:hypothetical protein
MFILYVVKNLQYFDIFWGDREYLSSPYPSAHARKIGNKFYGTPDVPEPLREWRMCLREIRQLGPLDNVKQPMMYYPYNFRFSKSFDSILYLERKSLKL